MAFLIQPTNSQDNSDNEYLRALIRDYKSKAELTWDQLASRIFNNSHAIQQHYKKRRKKEAVALFARTLSDFKTKESTSMPPAISDATLDYLSITVEKDFPELAREPRYQSLLERFVQAKNPFLLNEALRINRAEQEDFIENYCSTYLLISKANDARWEVRYLHLVEGILKHHSLPQFSAWRVREDNTYQKILGFAMKSGPHIFFTGNIVEQNKIWSAICSPIGRENDLIGESLFVDEKTSEIRHGACFLLNLHQLKANACRSFLGVKTESEMVLLKNILGTKRFDLFKRHIID